MNTLILFATKSGTTEKAAHLLKDLLPDAEVFNLAAALPDLTKYEAIIVGSGIRIGKIYKEANKFLQQNQELLQEKKSGFFICCALKEKSKQQIEDNFPSQLRQKALAVASFGGEMKVENLKGGAKFIAGVVAKQRQKDPAATAPSLSLETIRQFACPFRNTD